MANTNAKTPRFCRNVNEPLGNKGQETFLAILKNLLFGQLLKKIGPLDISTYSHTEFIERASQRLDMSGRRR